MRLVPLLLVAVAACGADGAGTDGTMPEQPEPGVAVRRVGGPLANAGPDLQVLEGQLVRLDAGSSEPGEAYRPLRYLWTVEPDGAAPLSIDDPTARRIRVVAPVLPPGVERADVRLRLRVDDGVERALDVVRLEVVRGPATAIAPVASAGPDLEVEAGKAVSIGPRPVDVDHALIEACADGPCPPPIVTWTPIDGAGATLVPIEAPTSADGCVPPCARVETDEALADGADADDVVAVLSYRVDVVSGATGLAAAPDFVRLFVRKGAVTFVAPTVSIDPVGPWYRRDDTTPLQVDGGANDPLGFRPVLGEAEPVPGGYGHTFVHAAPAFPSLLGWAFEGRNRRLRSAPRFLLADWRGLAAPVAAAGPDPVHLVDGEPVAPDGCDRVRLVGAPADACAQGRAHPELEFCWLQTHGPATLAGVPASCGERADSFESGSLLAGCDSDLACPDVVVPSPAGDSGRVLAFELKVRQRAHGATPASAWSAPDTAAIRVVSGVRNDPPSVRLALFRRLGDGSLLPLAGPIGEGETVVADASGSVDPEGRPLAYEVVAVGEGLAFAPYTPCPVDGACFAASTPAVSAPTSFPLAVAVDDGATVTVCGPGGHGGVCLDRDGAPIDAPVVVVDDSVP